MKLGTNIKKIREQKGLLQKQVSTELGIGNTNYNKLENGIREPSVKELQQLAKFFGMTVDQIINFEGELPAEVTMEGKPGFEQVNLINQLDDEDKATVSKSSRPCSPKRNSKTSSKKT